jgi:flagellar protein FlaF
MGFSVSTAFAVIVVAVFVAVSGLHAAASNGLEDVRDAQESQREHRDSVAETSINLTSATLLPSGTDCELRVLVNNTGDTRLSVSDTDLLVDGAYRTGWEGSARVDGSDGTDLWPPGTRLNATVDGFASPPERVKVVSGPGVAELARIDGGGVTC